MLSFILFQNYTALTACTVSLFLFPQYMVVHSTPYYIRVNIRHNHPIPPPRYSIAVTHQTAIIFPVSWSRAMQLNEGYLVSEYFLISLVLCVTSVLF